MITVTKTHTDDYTPSSRIPEVRDSRVEPLLKQVTPSTSKDVSSESSQMEEQRQLKVSSSQTSVTSISSDSNENKPQASNESDELSLLYINNLINNVRDNIAADSNNLSKEATDVLNNLITALTKTRQQADYFKMKAHLLSLSSKDADMRYEVENELIKREVERLKTQGEGYEDILRKYKHQKLLIKKYKHEIVEKNKEIIRLRGKNRSYSHCSHEVLRSEKKVKRSGSNNGMLDTLGLLASQVLTEESSNNRPPSFSTNSTNTSTGNSQNYALPKMNSFKHISRPTNDDKNDVDNTTIAEYSVN